MKEEREKEMVEIYATWPINEMRERDRDRERQRETHREDVCVYVREIKRENESGHRKKRLG